MAVQFRVRDSGRIKSLGGTEMKHVLVPLDGTKNAEGALPFLAELCQPGDRVVLLAVRTPERPSEVGTVPGQPVGGGFAGPSGGVVGLVTPDRPRYSETTEQTQQRQRSETADYLERLAKPLRASGVEVLTEVLLADRPAATIVDYARKARPTLIAMLRRTRLGLGERFFGSVATEVAEAEVAPVLFVPPTSQS